jgi:hypothetical protein
MPRLGGGGLGLVMALLLGASCGEGPAAPSSGTPAPMAPPTARALVAGGTGPGLRVDMAGTTHHVRALERQPDGTYRSICTDSADALRPAVARPPGAPR